VVELLPVTKNTTSGAAVHTGIGFFGNFLYARHEKNAVEAIEAKPA
jgi:hypothetical protein